MIKRLSEICRVRIAAAALLAAVMPVVAGCGLVDDPSVPCPPEGPDGHRQQAQITLSFRMISGNAGTRADSQGHDETDSEWKSFEDAIYERDFAFYIFLGEGNDAPLLTKVTDIASSSDPTSMITGTPGTYTVSVSISKTALEEKLGRELDETSTEPVGFRIVAFANTYSPGTGGDYDNVPCATYGELIEEAGKWTFDMSEIHNASEGWRQDVTGIYKGYLPMFGTKVFTATEENLATSRPEERFWLGEMSMLRALAKIRVIDNIADKKNGLPYVSSAVVIGTASRACPLPAGAAAYADGSQVHTANIAATAEGENTTFIMGYLGDSGSNEIFGYCPEQTITGGSPVMRITVVFEKDAAGVPAEYDIYDVPMKGYDGKDFSFGSEVLRNHIYTLSVDNVRRGIPANITVTVADWQQASLTLDFEQNVGVAAPLTWDESTLKGNNTATGTAVVLPWHDRKPVPAVAKFNISTPVGATWTAWFITKQGSPGAFMFVDDEGNRHESISGKVDDNPSTLRIIATEEEPAVDNEAEIQVVVQLGDGKYIEANICSEQAYSRYTIIQNRQ